MKSNKSVDIFFRILKLIFVKKEFLYIVSLSSLSSQLGFSISLKQHLLNNKYIKGKDKYFLILHFPNKIDPNCSYQIDFKFLKSYLFSKEKLKIDVFKLDNRFNRLLVFLFLQIESFKKKFIYKIKIVLIQTRPEWLFDRLSRFPFKSFIHFDDHLLIGDGLLSLELDAKPFWLEKKSKIKTKEDIKKYSYIYFLYNLNKNNNTYLGSPNLKQIKSKFISKQIRNFNNLNIFKITEKSRKYIKNFAKNKKKLILFAGTTFYETKRTDLKSEISLYNDYFESLNLLNEKIDIFFKPHPSSSQKKVNEISKNNIFGYQIIMNNDIYLEISNIPLEVLVDLLLNENSELKIFLPICSSGSFATTIIFPKNIYPIKAFGSKLINKYIKTEFVFSRLEQEKSIFKSMEKLGLTFIN